MDDVMREELGKQVRHVWVEYGKMTKGDEAKPSHVAPWEELSEWDKEADRVIGEYIASIVVNYVINGVSISKGETFRG